MQKYNGNNYSYANLYSKPVKLEAGDFLDFKLDYKSYGQINPLVKLSWDRPDDNNNNYEIISKGEYFSRAKGFNVYVPRGQNKAQFEIDIVDDNIFKTIISMTFEYQMYLILS